MDTQMTQSETEKSTGYFLWLKLKAALAWLKRAVMAMLIAGSFYIGAAQPRNLGIKMTIQTQVLY